MTKEERNFRWAYKAIIALAKIELQKMNDGRENENDWPAGQKWADLSSSSKSIFMKKAREFLGIDHDEFLEDVRSGRYDVDDLFD